MPPKRKLGAGQRKKSAKAPAEEQIIAHEVEEEESNLNYDAEEENEASDSEAFSDDDSDLPEELTDSDSDLNEDENEGSEEEIDIRSDSASEEEEEEKQDSKNTVKKEESNLDTTAKPITVNEDEDSDSDDQHVRNTIGNIPIAWYKDFDHIGYDLDGKKILKREIKDKLDEFLEKSDDPAYWRKVYDELNDEEIILTDKEIQMIKNIQSNKVADLDYNPYEEYVDFFDFKEGHMPLSSAPDRKAKFLPSLWERKTIVKYVRAMRKGWLKPPSERKKEEAEKQRLAEQAFDLWEKEEELDNPHHIPAPKMPLPTHSESYNPPEEYLLTEKEKEEWENLDPEDRPHNYIPQKYPSMRQVPLYQKLINERFERCLDLYLCPRARKQRMNVDPESLLPKLPKPRDLQPFPNVEGFLFKGHAGKVRSISIHPSGQWLASACDDSTVRVWEVRTGRCWHTYTIGAAALAFEDDASVSTIPSATATKATCVEWNPNPNLCLLAICVGPIVYLLNTHTGNPVQIAATTTILTHHKKQAATTPTGVEPPPVELDEDGLPLPAAKTHAVWAEPPEVLLLQGITLAVRLHKLVKSICWHHKGEYFATVAPEAMHSACVIHHLGKQSSQNPFKKHKGTVQKALFHPSKPFFFVATKRYVRVVNLAKQEQVRTLQPGVQWISSMSIHPGGDNLLIGSYDKRMCWFDMDLSTKPYKTLRFHKYAVRQVTYHPRYPLFASCSDDSTALVFHGMVYNDLLENPLIVPVKILRGHRVTANLGVLDCVWHPHQPWLFTAGADGDIRVYVNL